MQFIQNGPDIPNSVLQAQEEEKLVFFCGAGISFPAGLPSFKGLVSEIYQNLGTPLEELEVKPFNEEKYDQTLDLLERRYPGEREKVRTVLWELLQPNFDKKNATRTHEAILTLSNTKNSMCRLVTTNFDRIFEQIITKNELNIERFAAPMLPVPKHSRWNGLVYLHGLLPPTKDIAALNRLVLSSGDFGNAYLNERWASRFVSELFKNYTVCFVGYSINDPVMRYMIDALTADRNQGEKTPFAYAFVDHDKNNLTERRLNWSAKGVIPILYKNTDKNNSHSYLHDTLDVWAETYRDGILGKERIVLESAKSQPSKSTREDDYIGRLIWAISDPSGLPAKKFAEMEPVPSLEWFEYFSEKIFTESDLRLFGVSKEIDDNIKFKFSLVSRPTSHDYTPWAELFIKGDGTCKLDNVMHQLARWIIRHLPNPDLLFLCLKYGGHLNPYFKMMIFRELDLNLDIKNKKNISSEIPLKLKTAWRLLIDGHLSNSHEDISIYTWIELFKNDGLTTRLRLQLRNILAPRIHLSKPLSMSTLANDDSSVADEQIFNCELDLACAHVHSAFKELGPEIFNEHCEKLINDFQMILVDALDLMREVGFANEFEDRSTWDLPSIHPHTQNRFYRNWVSLIDILRQTWLALWNKNPKLAAKYAEDWFVIPYPTFKRLALYAASLDNCIKPTKWVEWFAVDDGYWLWSSFTIREVIRLLVLQGQNLNKTQKTKLENALSKGPYIFKQKFGICDSQMDYFRWLYISKLKISGIKLGAPTNSLLKRISKEHPEWQLSVDERDEFAHWMSSSFGNKDDSSLDDSQIPFEKEEIKVWLKEALQSDDKGYLSLWRTSCDHNFKKSASALSELQNNKIWSTGLWDVLLEFVSREDNLVHFWDFYAPFLVKSPNSFFNSHITKISWWIEKISKNIRYHEAIFFEYCSRIFDTNIMSELTSIRNGQRIETPVLKAINHPIGQATSAILNFWFSGGLKDGQMLTGEFLKKFNQLCNNKNESYLFGRIILAANVVALYRVDKTWTVNSLLPYFDWERCSLEAKAIWAGFLWTNRFFSPLMFELKDDFLNTSNHIGELGEFSNSYIDLITFCALDRIDGFTEEEFRKVFLKFNCSSLEIVAKSLLNALENSGDQREEFFNNRISPFWQSIWPKNRALISEPMAEKLTLICIESKSAFGKAVELFFSWFIPIEDLFYVITKIEKAKICNNYPADSLKLLDAIIENITYAAPQLKKCLESISMVEPSLVKEQSYIRLNNLIRQQS